MLNLVNVSFAYDKKSPALLENISCNVAQGELVGVIGANGSGKTTLLKLIVGLLPLTAGRIAIDGEVFESPQKTIWGKRKMRPRSAVGYVSQFADSQIFERTVGWQLSLALGEKVANDGSVSDTVLTLLSMVGLPKKYVSQSPWHLSGGERRKLALATTLAKKPKLLLLDEPLVGLDQKSALEFFAVLHALSVQGMAIIVVSHNTELLWEYADRILCLKDSHCIADGKSRDILQDEQLLASLNSTMPVQAVLYKALQRALSQNGIIAQTGKSAGMSAEIVQQILQNYDNISKVKEIASNE